MAGPGGREVGRVSIRVLPDTSSFARSLERYLERLERTLRVEIPVEVVGAIDAEAQLDALARDRTASIKVDVDGAGVAALQKGIGSVGGNATGPGGLAIAAALIAGIGALLPVIATGILALPGLLMSLLIPIGAVVLGFEGIKKAAEGLADPFKAMRKSLANTFEGLFTPIFKNLQKLFKPLTEGFGAVAEGIAAMFGSVVDGLTSPKGINEISAIFASLGEAFKIIAPSLKPLTEAFLTLMRAGMDAFVRIAPALAGLTEEFANWVKWADQTGVLAKAFEFFGDIILGLLTLFMLLVMSGTQIAAWIIDVKNAIAEFVDKLPGRIKSVGEIIMGFIEALPTVVLAALAELGSMLAELAVRAMLRFAAAIGQNVSRIVQHFRELPGKIVAAVGDLALLLYGTGYNLVKGFAEGIGDALSLVTDAVGVLGSVAQLGLEHVLEINSPSRVFEQLGRYTVQGFVRGIDRTAADARAAVGAMAGSLSAPALVGASYLDEGSLSSSRGGPAMYVAHQTVMAHDYNAFVAQQNQRQQRAAVTGVE